MNTCLLPIFSFKTTMMIVDDIPLQLETLSLSFSKRFNCKTFSDPLSAIGFLEKYNSKLCALDFILNAPEKNVSEDYNQLSLSLDFSKILALAKNKDRHNEISVLMVDYNMPGINGIELCERIKALPFKKILLTGETSFQKAVDAFNKGLIDRFVRKDAENMWDEIKRFSEELHLQFLRETSNKIYPHLKLSNNTILFDTGFFNFFKNWCEKNNADEFYLIDQHGSFLTIDTNNKIRYFVAYTANYLDEFVKLNDDCTNKVGHLLNDVSERKSIPFFGFGKNYWDIELSEWKNHFYSAQEYIGDDQYYWAIIE